MNGENCFQLRFLSHSRLRSIDFRILPNRNSMLSLARREISAFFLDTQIEKDYLHQNNICFLHFFWHKFRAFFSYFISLMSKILEIVIHFISSPDNTENRFRHTTSSGRERRREQKGVYSIIANGKKRIVHSQLENWKWKIENFRSKNSIFLSFFLFCYSGFTLEQTHGTNYYHFVRLNWKAVRKKRRKT